MGEKWYGARVPEPTGRRRGRHNCANVTVLGFETARVLGGSLVSVGGGACRA